MAGGVGDSEGRIKTQQNRKRKNGKNGKVSLVHNWGLTTVMGQYGLLSAIQSRDIWIYCSDAHRSNIVSPKLAALSV